MRPLLCSPAPAPPGPFDLTAPHIVAGLVWPILFLALISLSFGCFKTIQHFWWGVGSPEQRLLWWLRSLRNLCFTVGFPPLVLVISWLAAVEAWKEAQARQGCPVPESAAIFPPDSFAGFFVWLILGVGMLVAFVVLEMFIEGIGKRQVQAAQAQQPAPRVEEPPNEGIAGQPGVLAASTRRARRRARSLAQQHARDTWLYKSGMIAIVLVLGAASLMQGAALLHAGATPTPTKNIIEFALPTAYSIPLGITAGPDGNLWFTEHAGKLGRISPAGVMTEFPVPRPDSGPEAITAGPDGNLWFTDGGSIGRITLGGTITEFPLPRAGSLSKVITTGRDGDLWFTEAGNSQDHRNAIGRITPKGAITEFPLPVGSNPPGGITVGPDGNLWFTEEDREVIERLTLEGTITEFPLPINASPPEWITAGPDGSLWVTEWITRKIGRMTPEGAYTQFSLWPGSGHLGQIIAGPDGNLWFTDPGDVEVGGDLLVRVTPEGTLTPVPLAQASNLSAVAAGPDGNLWFTAIDDNAIGYFLLK